MAVDTTKHHISILRQDGSTEVPMMLATEKDKEGHDVPIYWTSDDEYIAETERGQSSAERELPPIIGDDWRSGIGLDVYDSADPLRYLSSVNCDLRFRGQAMLSYAATGLALPATSGVPTCQASFNGVQYIGCGTKLNQAHANGASITNVTTFTSPISALEPFADGFMYVGFEGTTVVSDCETAWTAGNDVTVSLDSGDKKVGTYSNKFVVADAFTGGTVAYITFPTLSAYDGVKLWIKCSVDTTAGQLKLKFINVEIDIPALSAGVWTRVYLKFTSVVSGGNFLFLLSTDIGACTIHIDDILAENLIQRMDSGENFTKTTEADGFAHFLKTVNATAPALWKGLKPNELKSATSPFGASAWSIPKIVDTSIYNITDLVSSQNTLYIMKEDRPFYLDTSSNVQVLVDDTKHLASSTGGKNSTSWQEKVYMPYGTQSLVEYDSGTITWRDPAKFCASLGDYDGYVRAVAGDEQWLFAILDSATADKVEVLAGRLETVNGSTSWVWHAIAQVAMTDCNMAFVSSIYQRRLWIGSTNSANSIFYIPLPAGYGDPANDTNKSFSTATGQYFITPWLHAGFKGDSKAFIKLSLKMSGTSSTVYWRAYYKRLGQAAWREINPTAKFKTSPITSGYIPVDADSNEPVSTAIRFKFEGKTGSTASTPILLDYDCRAILYPSRRNIIHCIVRCADNILDKKGSALGVTASTIRDTLNEAKNTATWPVTFYDINGDTKYVRFLPVNPYSKVNKDEKGRNIEEWYYLEMMEVTLS